MTILSLPSTRRSASQRRRAPQIIEAAARVFAERGFHGATTQDIANVLGIRQASLYYYFSSKEAALALVCLKGVEGFFEAAKAIASSGGTAQERLSLLINSHLSPLLDRGDFVKVFLNERQHLPAESRPHRRWSAGWSASSRTSSRRRRRRIPCRSRHADDGAGHSRHVQCNIELVPQGKRLSRAHQRGIHPSRDRRGGQAPHLTAEKPLIFYRAIEFGI
jgi:AcrR family transcriptional regulator